MKKQPSKLLISKIWLNRNQAAIVANTPSSEKIIAAGAGEMFFCAENCNTNVNTPDNIPAYCIDSISFNLLTK